MLAVSTTAGTILAAQRGARRGSLTAVKWLSFGGRDSILGSVILGLLFSASVAQALQLYTFDNGSTSYNYGSEMAGFQQADDFWLSSDCYVTGARFWTIEGYGIRQNSIEFDGHINYWVYSSVNGQPGDILSAGEAAVFSRVATGLKDRWWGSMYGYEYTFDLLTPFQAQADQHYFLALHLLNYYPDPNGEIYWATADGPIPGASSYSRDGGIGTWTDNSQTVGGVYGAGHLAYQVYAESIPEPSTLALLSMSALGLPAYARRRRK
jgi:hypothetical protein